MATLQQWGLLTGIIVVVILTVVVITVALEEFAMCGWLCSI